MNLYAWQKDCIEKIREKDAIVSAPTGAGKTKVAYMYMDIQNAIKGKHRVFYTVPIKALANEKYDELKAIYGEENVGIRTGDVIKNEKAPILVCTQEIYTRHYVKKKFNAKIIIDEFHYVFTDANRARAYIDAFHYANMNHKFLVLSATFGNPSAVKKYLDRISNRNFELYETNFRPTQLIFTNKEYSLETLQPNTLVYAFSIKVLEYLAQYAALHVPPLPIFKRRRIKKIADSYKVNLSKFPYISRGIVVYHSKLTYTEKKFIEFLVRQNLIKIVFSTNALGVGVNLPIENVIFAMFHIPQGLRQYRKLTKIEFLQLAGRAGRAGFFDTGYISILKHPYFDFVEDNEERRKIYQELLEKEMEFPKISLTLDVEKIAKNLVSIDDEIEYVCKYSLPERNYNDVKLEAAIILRQLESVQEYRKYFTEFFMPELSIAENAEVIKYLLSNVKTKSISIDKCKTETYKYIEIDALSIPISRPDEITTLLLKRRIAYKLSHSLFDNKEVEVKNIHVLEERIRQMDPLLLL